MKAIRVFILAILICGLVGCVSKPYFQHNGGVNDRDSAVAEFVDLYTCEDPVMAKEQFEGLQIKLEELRGIVHDLRGKMWSGPGRTTNTVHQIPNLNDTFPDRGDIADIISDIYMQELRILMERKALEMMILEHKNGH